MTQIIGAPALFTLQRLDYTERATFGAIHDAENREIVKTLELPWKYNAPKISCIPPGRYRGELFKSPKRGYRLYRLLSVPGRSSIEIHIGNTTADSQGCILVGTRFGDLGGGVMGVLESRPAFAKWMEATHFAEYITLDVKAPVVPEIIA
jgi:hypothetical protein